MKRPSNSCFFLSFIDVCRASVTDIQTLVIPRPVNASANTTLLASNAINVKMVSMVTPRREPPTTVSRAHASLVLAVFRLEQVLYVRTVLPVTGETCATGRWEGTRVYDINPVHSYRIPRIVCPIWHSTGEISAGHRTNVW